VTRARARSAPLRAAAALLAAGALLAPAAPGRAAPAAGPADARAALDAHCRARERATTLRARFVQTRIFTAIGEEERASGVLYYRKPDRLRWEYERPDRSWTVLDGKRGWAVFPGTRQVQRFELGAGRGDAILSVVGFGACGPGFAQAFDVSLARDERGAQVLSMTPRNPELRASFRAIELTLDRNDHLPRRVLLHETTGDEVRFDFDDVRTGVKLEGSLFEFTSPEGYSVGP
jgi:outer membrane lipoprotein carrier protein